jgi:predicted kinase
VQELAKAVGADFYIIECRLDEEETRRRLERRVQSPSISDGRWELYSPQKDQFEAVNEVVPKRHFVIDSGQPLEGQISRVIEGIAQNE